MQERPVSLRPQPDCLPGALCPPALLRVASIAPVALLVMPVLMATLYGALVSAQHQDESDEVIRHVRHGDPRALAGSSQRAHLESPCPVKENPCRNDMGER